MPPLPYIIIWQRKVEVRRAVFHGFLAGITLLTIYFLVMGLASKSWDYTISQLITLRYWIGALVLGFGIQVGLFSYLRSCRKKTKLGSKITAVSTGTSSAAMLACCAHHLTDLLPFLGLATVTLVLARYQTWFLALGVASNILGIILMIRQLKKR